MSNNRERKIKEIGLKYNYTADELPDTVLDLIYEREINYDEYSEYDEDDFDISILLCTFVEYFYIFGSELL
jgi:hypothetical protein